MDTAAGSPRLNIQWKNVFALSLLPALALSFPIIVFFKFQRFWSWTELHIYAAFLLGLLISLLLKRTSWAGKFLAISAPTTTYLLFLSFNLGNPFAGVDYLVLMVMYTQIITHVGIGLFLFTYALKAIPSAPSSPPVNLYILASTVLGFVLGAGILYMSYLSWTVGYLLAGLTPGACAAAWFWRPGKPEEMKNLSAAGPARPVRTRRVLTFFTAIFGTAILAGVLMFMGGTSLGLLSYNTANVGYFDRIVDSSPDFLFNYYGLPGTLLVGGGVGAVLLALTKKRPQISPALPYIFLLGGCWGYFCLQGLFYFNVLPPIAGNLLLGIPFVLVFCATFQWAQSRFFQLHDVNRGVLYLVILLAIGLGLILPSDSGAIDNLGDEIYLVIAAIPAVAATVTLLVILLIIKRKGRLSE